MNKLQAIAYADLTVGHAHYAGGNSQTCSPMMQKCLLLAIAASEGELLTANRLSQLASCSPAAVHRVLRVLTEMGLVVDMDPMRARNKPGLYQVGWNQLMKHIPEAHQPPPPKPPAILRKRGRPVSQGVPA